MSINDSIQDNTLDLVNALNQGIKSKDIVVWAEEDVITIQILGVADIKLTNNLKNGGDNWIVNTYP